MGVGVRGLLEEGEDGVLNQDRVKSIGRLKKEEGAGEEFNWIQYERAEESVMIE